MRPVSVNFHLYKPCNYRCRFCFATFRDVDGHLIVLLNSEREFCLTLPDVQNFAPRDVAHIRFSAARCLLLANSLSRLCRLSKAGLERIARKGETVNAIASVSSGVRFMRFP